MVSVLLGTPSGVRVLRRIPKYFPAYGFGGSAGPLAARCQPDSCGPAAQCHSARLAPIVPSYGNRVAVPVDMKTRGLTVPEIVLIGGTRVALGAGIGFLLSGRLNKDQRNAAGWALFAVGALSSIPI